MRSPTLLFACGAIALVSAHPVVEWRDSAKAAVAANHAMPQWTPEHDAALKRLVAQVSDLSAPHMKQAASVLGAKLSPLMDMAKSRYPSLFPGHGRKLQLEQLGAILGQPPYNPNTILNSVRSTSCSAEATAGIKQIAEQVIPSLGIAGLPSVPNLVDALWPCFCNDLTFGPEVEALVALAQSSDAASNVAALSSAARKAIPELFSSLTLCGSSCRTAGIALVDFLVAAGDALLASPALAGQLPFAIPKPSQYLSGYGAAEVSCFCDGVDWNQLVALFSDDLTVAVESLVETAFTQDLATLSDGASSAISRLAAIPQFLTSEQGFCSGTGCVTANRQLLNYGLAAGGNVLSWARTQIPNGAALVTAYGALDGDSLIGCFCGQTIQYEATFLGLADALAAFTDSFADTIGAVLGSVFSPTLLCSSAECKEVTTDLMGVVGAAGGISSDLEFLTPISTVQWCPASSGAGTVIKQSFTIGGDVSSFGAAARDVFKGKLVTKINSAITDALLKVNKGMVSLAVSEGSVLVEASIAASSPTLVSEVETSMTAISSEDPSTLSADLGVTVEAVSVATSAVVAESVSRVASGGGGGGGGGDDSSSTGLIIGIAAGVGGLVIVAAAFFMCKPKATVGVSPKA